MNTTNVHRIKPAGVGIVVGIAFAVAASACIVNDDSASATSCDPPDEGYVCVACTGGTCGIAPSQTNKVTAQVIDFRGTRKAVKDAETGLDSVQNQESGCEFKLDYTCDGVHHTRWEHGSSSGDWKNQIPAGANCPHNG